MKRQILIFIAVWAVALSGLVLYLNWRYRTVPVVESDNSSFSSGGSEDSSSSSLPPEPPKYQCLGKVYCSEMTSCEEATFYLRNCPGTKMDGDNDGIPCEGQWCKH